MITFALLLTLNVPKPEPLFNPATANVALPAIVQKAENPESVPEEAEPPALKEFAKLDYIYPDADLTNMYQPGQCVWGIKRWRPELPGNWGNGYEWYDNAQAIGWPTGLEPQVNAVGVAKYGNHVVLVLAVHGETITVREMNYRYVPYAVRTDTKLASSYRYIY